MARILIIEDETAIAELEKDYLKLSDFEVVLEPDGSGGAARALDEDFDLIILDLMLPGMNGFDICKLIRETKNTPIIMVSAKSEDIDKIRGLGLGADDYMTFLAENPNHVFTKEELFREIWEMESVGDIATVTVHIKKIREKIEDSSSKPQYIETIWGVGYRFKV